MLIRILNILFCIVPQYVERILDNMANNFNEAFAGGKMIPKRLRLCFAFAKHKGSTKRKKLLSLFCVNKGSLFLPKHLLKLEKLELEKFNSWYVYCDLIFLYTSSSILLTFIAIWVNHVLKHLVKPPLLWS